MNWPIQSRVRRYIQCRGSALVKVIIVGPVSLVMVMII